MPRKRRWYRGLKRCIDISGATVGLVLGSPVMLAIALAILLESGRPVFYSARRVAQHGNPISVVKFRTMRADAERVLARLLREPSIAAEYAQNFKLQQDPRCTRLGRLLRKTSLDELPQLWNVLVGAMSLVGPRPIVADELPLYRAVPHGEGAYLAVKPGLTGLWQVSGRNETTYDERVRLDLEYVRKRSLLGDVRILLRTPAAALTGV